MDTWNKYKDKSYKINLYNVDISKTICYGNYLISKIAYQAICNKVKQRTINSFFETASIVIHATVAQNKVDNFEKSLEYIEEVTRSLMNSNNSSKELGLLIGNLTEYQDTHYTFIELIAFIRCIAAKI